MKPYVFRLRQGQDLRKGIEDYLAENNILGGCVVSGVGCVSKVNIRLAKAIDSLEKDEDYEIVSLMGTSSKNGSHFHISFSDEKGNTIGGHLKYGTIVNTTCEVVYLYLEEYEMTREFDNQTGYDELVVTSRK